MLCCCMEPSRLLVVESVREEVSRAWPKMIVYSCTSVPLVRLPNPSSEESVPAPEVASNAAPTFTNPVAAILGLRDSLHLSAEQVGLLQVISDSLDIENRAASDSVQTEAQRLSDRVPPAEVRARLEPKVAAERANIRRALERARSVLAPAQWANVPDGLKST